MFDGHNEWAIETRSTCHMEVDQKYTSQFRVKYWLRVKNFKHRLQTISDSCRPNVVGIRASRNYAEILNNKANVNLSLA
jgi:hypothetical protein